MAISKINTTMHSAPSTPSKAKKLKQKPRQKLESHQTQLNPLIPTTAAAHSHSDAAPPQSTQPPAQRGMGQLDMPLTQPRTTAGSRLPANLVNPKIRRLATSSTPFHRSSSHPPLSQPTSNSNTESNLVWPSLEPYSQLSPQEILARFAPKRSLTPATKKLPTASQPPIPPDLPNGQALQTPESTQPRSSQHYPDHNPPLPPNEPLQSTQVDKRNSKKNPSSQSTKRRRSSRSVAEPTDALTTLQSPHPLAPNTLSSVPNSNPHPGNINNTTSQGDSPHEPSKPTSHEPPDPKSPSRKSKNNPDQAAKHPPQNSALLHPEGSTQTPIIQKKNKAKLAELERPSSRPKKKIRLNNHAVLSDAHSSMQTSSQATNTICNRITENADRQTKSLLNNQSSSWIDSQDVSAPWIQLESNGQQAQTQLKVLTAARKSRSIVRSDKCPSRENSVEPVKTVLSNTLALARSDAEKTKPQGELNCSRATRSKNKKTDAATNTVVDQASSTPDRSPGNRTSDLRKSSPDISSGSDPEASETDVMKQAEAQDPVDLRAKRVKRTKKLSDKSGLSHPILESSSTITSDQPTSSEPSNQLLPPRELKDLEKPPACNPDPLKATQLQPELSPSPVSQGPHVRMEAREFESPMHRQNGCSHGPFFDSQSENFRHVKDYEPRMMMPDDSNASSRRSVSTDRNSFLKKQKNKAKLKAKRLQKKHPDFTSEATMTPIHQTPVKSPLVIPTVSSILSKKVEPQPPVQPLEITRASPSNVPKHFGRWELTMPSSQDVPIAVLARMHQFLDEAVCAGFAKPIFRDPTPTGTNVNTPRGTEYPNSIFKSSLPITTLPPINHSTGSNGELVNRSPCTTPLATSANPFFGSVPTKAEETRLPSPRNEISKSFSSGSSSVSDDINDTVMMALGLGESGLDGSDTSLNNGQPTLGTSENHYPSATVDFNLQKEILAPDSRPQLSVVPSNTNSDQSSPTWSSLNITQLDNPRVHDSLKKPGERSIYKIEKTTLPKKSLLPTKARPEASDSSGEDETESSDEDEENRRLNKTQARQKESKKVAEIQSTEPKSMNEELVRQTKRSPQKSKMNQVSPTLTSGSPDPPIPDGGDEIIKTCLPKKVPVPLALKPEESDSTSEDQTESSDEDEKTSSVNEAGISTQLKEKEKNSSNDSSSDSSSESSSGGSSDDDSDSSSDSQPSQSGNLACPSISPQHDQNQAVDVNQKAHENQVKQAVKMSKPENKATVPVSKSKSESSSSEEEDEETEGSKEDGAPPSAQRPTTSKHSDQKESYSSSSEEKEDKEKESDKNLFLSRPRSASAEIESMAINNRDDPFVLGYCGRAPMTGRRKTLEAFKPNDFSVDSFNLSVPSNPNNQKNPTLDQSSDDDESSSSSSDEDDTDTSNTKGANQTKRNKNTSINNGLPAHKLAGSQSKYPLNNASLLQNKRNKKQSMARIWAKEESKIINSKHKR